MRESRPTMRNARATLARTLDEDPLDAPVRALPAERVAPGRLTFVDLSRALATLMMIQGHTLDALLLPDYRTSSAYYVWLFVRGLTSCLFLFLSGFVFSVATIRRWPSHTSSIQANIRRARRFGSYFALGYLLHFPVAKLTQVRYLTTESWHQFLAVDVLQCIAVTLCALQILVVLTRTPKRFAIASAVCCLAVLAVTPVLWRTAAVDRLPFALGAYLSSNGGSAFPLFPWSAYMLLGATLGVIYVHRPFRHQMDFANRILLPSGVVMVSAALVCSTLPFGPFGVTDFWSTSPNQFLLRAGIVLAVVWSVAHLSRHMPSGHTIVRSLAQESLSIYFVHVCIVYGSVWNQGLFQSQGHAVSLLPALGYVVVLWVGMTLMATAWNRGKRFDPRMAQWLRLGAVGAFVVSLIY